MDNNEFQNEPQNEAPKRSNGILKPAIIVISAALVIAAGLLAFYFISNTSANTDADTETETAAATGTKAETEGTAQTEEAAGDLSGSLYSYDLPVSEKHGAYKGKNVIVFEVPGLIEKAVGLEYGGFEVTPNVNALLNESSYYKNCIASANDPESLRFVINNSLYAPQFDVASAHYDGELYGLPAILKENGYKTYLFSCGSEARGDVKDFDRASFISYDTREKYSALGNNSEKDDEKTVKEMTSSPFFAFVCCGYSQYPYFSEKIGVFASNNGADDYLNALHREDEAIGKIISYLKSNGAYEDTVIIVTGTPNAYDPENEDQKKTLAKYTESYTLKDSITVPLILKLGAKEESDKLTSQIDIMPTLLDLLGIDNEKVFFAGENLFTTKRETVYIQTGFLRGSFVNGERTVSADKTLSPRNSRSYNHSTGRTGTATGAKSDMLEGNEIFEDFDLALASGIVKRAKEIGRASAIKEFEENKGGMEKIQSYSIADKFPENESADFYKSDIKLFHRSKMLSANEFDGVFDGVIFKNDGLTLLPGRDHGYFVSSDIYLGGEFSKLIASWNANTAGGTVEICVSAKKSDRTYTDWYSWGVWSQIEGVSKSRSSSDKDGAIDIDTLDLKKACPGYVRVRIALKKTGETSPVLYNFTLAANIGKGALSKEIKTESAAIYLPKYYQMDVPDIGGRICSPTSLTMVLDGYGEDLKPEETAAGVYDNKEKIYGNWSYNVAYAGELGYNAYVDIYDENALKTALSKGVAVICSIKVKKGQFTGSGYPNYSTSGHLLVITGYETADGKLWLKVNDPVQKNVAVKYLMEEFNNVWAGTVYVVQKHPERFTRRIGEGTDRDILIIADYVPEGRYNRPGGNFKVKYIVIHNTGNFSSGADAMSHRNYIKQDGTKTSWHYTVDDTSIYKHLPEEERAWHAGDGREGRGNTYGIGIEICVNHESLGETKCSGYFMEALENAAMLCAELMYKYDLKMSAITQHFDYSGKNCPQVIRECGLWDDFRQMIKTRYDEIVAARGKK